MRRALSEKYLTEADKTRINEAVTAAEKITSGEIIPMVVSSSYSYPLADFIGGFAFGLIAALGAVLILHNQNLWFFLIVFIIAFPVFREIIKHVLPLKRLFLSHKEINEEVEEAALKAFYQNGLYKTKDETGVLIFISLFENIFICKFILSILCRSLIG